MNSDDLQNINPFDLESVSYEDRHLLPRVSGVYFALTMPSTISYIGLSRSLRQRWRRHSKRTHLNLKALRIAWMPAAETDLRKIEEALIQRFNPPLNGIRLVPSDGFTDIPVRHLPSMKKQGASNGGPTQPRGAWSEWDSSGIRCRNDGTGWEYDFWPGDYQEHLRWEAEAVRKYGSVKAAVEHFLANRKAA